MCVPLLVPLLYTDYVRTLDLGDGVSKDGCRHEITPENYGI